jgi:RNA polymerase sigma-70 factor (ECF subfamily)
MAMAGFSDVRPDPAIIRRAQHGDMKAHEVLYASYARPVYTLACRILDRPALADEVLQDTAVEVIRKLGDIREPETFPGWVKRIAVNKCLSQLRSPWHKRGVALDRGEGGPSLDPVQADHAPVIDAGTDLTAALAELSPLTRTVLWLYDVEGYTHAEIGNLMGKSTSFSKSQLARAHQRLREMLGDARGANECTQTSNNS